MAGLLLGQPKVNATQAHLLLLEAYQQSSGIFNHLALAAQIRSAPADKRVSLERPWAVIAAHPATNTSVRSIYGDRYLEYRQSNVLKYTGVPWDRFQQLSVSEADMLIQMGKAELKEELRKQRDDADQQELTLALAREKAQGAR